jgi:hypothetical protein
MGSLAQIRERTAPSMWTSLELYAGSRITTQLPTSTGTMKELAARPKSEEVAKPGSKRLQ